MLLRSWETSVRAALWAASVSPAGPVVPTAGARWLTEATVRPSPQTAPSCHHHLLLPPPHCEIPAEVTLLGSCRGQARPPGMGPVCGPCRPLAPLGEGWEAVPPGRRLAAAPRRSSPCCSPVVGCPWPGEPPRNVRAGWATCAT